VGSPFDGVREDTGADETNIWFWIISILLVFGLLFISIGYSATSGNNGSGHSPTEEEHHEF
jgi:hypothetical protein